MVVADCDPCLPGDDLAAISLVAHQPGTALCTIINIDGSFSRRVGAQLAIAADGRIAGSLTDGCLERELASQARHLAASGPQVLRFGKGSPFIDFRLPCGSGLDILIDPRPDRAAAQAVLTQLDQRRAASMTLPGTDDRGALERVYLPPLQLSVFGRGPERDWLAHLAASAGLRCEVIGPERGLNLGVAPSNATPDRWTAIVLLFHDHEWEAPILDWALRSPACYIGAIGGEGSRKKRIEQMRARGWSDAELVRVRSPIGLIPRTRDAMTLALSILAEVVGCYEELRQPLP